MELVPLKWSSVDFLITWVCIWIGGTSLLMHDMYFVDDLLICFVNLIFQTWKERKKFAGEKIITLLTGFCPPFLVTLLLCVRLQIEFLILLYSRPKVYSGVSRTYHASYLNPRHRNPDKMSKSRRKQIVPFSWSVTPGGSLDGGSEASNPLERGCPACSPQPGSSLLSVGCLLIWCETRGEGPACI